MKLQLNLHFPMACAAYPEEETTWLAMGGQVREILGPDRVRVAGLVSTTDRAPLAFEGEWIAELRARPATGRRPERGQRTGYRLPTRGHIVATAHTAAICGVATTSSFCD